MKNNINNKGLKEGMNGQSKRGKYLKSKEHKIKLSISNQGNKPWNDGVTGDKFNSHFKKGSVWNKGMRGLKVHSEEHKNKLRESMTGNKYKEGISPWNKGKKYKSVPCPEEKKKRISSSLKGHPCYKDEGRRRKASLSMIEWYKNHPEAIVAFTERRKHIKIPKKDSSIEVKIQNYLKELNVEYMTHQYMNIEHGYQCDIFIPSINLIIECDGDYWHKYPTGLDRDHIRTKELMEKGFKVLRLWERDIRKMSLVSFNQLLEIKRGKI